MDDYDDLFDENPCSASLSVTYEGKEDTLWFQPGDNPSAQIQNRVNDLHGTSLAMWIFYAFGISLIGMIAGTVYMPLIGIVAAACALGMTVKFVLFKHRQMWGLIAEWQSKLTGKPVQMVQQQSERLGPPAEWITD